MGHYLIEMAAEMLLPIKKKMAGGAALIVGVVTLLATIYIALVFAGWFALEPIYGAAYASLIVAAAALLLVALIFVATWIVRSLKARRYRAQAARQAASSEAQMADLAVNVLPLLVQKRPVASIGLAVALGFLASKAQQK